ncbi:hypothetical protein SmJEL517_g00440 [Synchytrium microbalum]|uniref:C2 domain-containing protein n=1 Tax=Synchytrium microbalum TaxID=1806994 RepID=A0A507CJ10_9FUNG|nr:uncharacterized protein SmJEL517_g00440 [Synchytrium microbalum]TPX37755.1 hypothetical protein SmJEL517_g00440 [Synchytrium microbalum]
MNLSANSLPPKLTGPIKSILHLCTDKLVWTDPPSPSRSNNQSQQNILLPSARVRVSWWGEDPPGVVLQPSITGAGVVKSPRPSSLPILQSRIHGNSVATPPPPSTAVAKDTIKYAVRCGKKQFAQYLKDMGSLKLQIVTGGRVVGIASIKTLNSLCEESEHDGINGFFPVMSVQQSPSGEIQTLGRKLGELHVVVSLEAVSGSMISAGSSSHSLPQVAPRQEMDLADMVVESRQPPLVNASKVEVTRMDTPASGVVDAEKLDSFMKDSSLSDIQLPQLPDLDTSVDLVAAGNTTTDSVQRDFEIESYQESDDYTSSDPLDVEDDVIIEAINSRAGRSLLDRRLLNSRSNDMVDIHDGSIEDRDDEDDEEVLQGLDLDDLYSEDDITPKQLAKEVVAKPVAQVQPQEPPIHSGIPLSIDTLTSLGRVTTAVIHIARLELLPSVLSPLTTHYNINVTLPSSTPPTVLLPPNDDNMVTAPAPPRLGSYRPSTAINAKPPTPVTVLFDRTLKLPIRFDETSIKTWMARPLQLKLEASQSFSRASEIKRTRRVWSGTGLIAGKVVLEAMRNRWSGPVKIWTDISDSAAVVGGSGKKAVRARREIGDMILDVSLVEEFVGHSSYNSNPKPAVTFAATTPPPSSPRQQPAASIENASIAAPPISPAIVLPPPPQYFYFRVSTARALAVLPPVPGSTTLLSVSVRLFTPGPPIESAPVQYRAPFDLSTGKVGEPTDFAFVYTVPVAATPEFFSKHYNKPLILEVWAMETAHDEGPRLLGLVKLPLHALLAAAEARLLGPNNSSQEAVMVPDAEYALIDPFTGSGKGWVKSFLAFGSWAEICRVRKGLDDDNEGYKARLAEKREAKARKNQAAEASRVEEAKKAADAAKLKSNSAEISLEVTVHRACGLKPLVASAASQTSQGTYGPLDHALEVGASPYVAMYVFAPDNRPRHNDALDDATTLIRTRTLASTFTPDYEQTVIVGLKGLDYDIGEWIMKGGELYGEIRHHMSGTLETDVLLGTFSVPLVNVLTRSYGISQVWLPVIDASGGSTPAAVQVSVKAPNLEDQVMGGLVGTPSSEQTDLRARLKLQIGEIILPNREVDVLDWMRTSQNSILDPVEEGIWLRWRPHHVGAWQESAIHYISDRSSPLDLGYHGFLDVEVNPTELQLLDVEVWSQPAGTPKDSEIVGSAVVDWTSMVDSLRRARRRSNSVETTVAKLDQDAMLIHPQKANLGGAQLDLHVELQALKPVVMNNVFGLTSPIPQPIPAPHPMAVKPVPVIVNPVATVPIHVSIFRAQHIPAVPDLLSVESPFADPGTTQMSAPHVYVTFTWPQQQGVSVGQQTFKTPIARPGGSPIWEVDFVVYAERTLNALSALRGTPRSVLDVHVWHSIKTNRISTADDDAIKIGTARVDLSALVSGVRELHGWYAIQRQEDVNGTTCGELLVRVRPSEDLTVLMKELGGSPSRRDDVLVSPDRNTPPVLLPTKGVTVIVPSPDRQNGDKGTVAAAAAASAGQVDSGNSQTVDTWVWNGSAWEHKRVEVSGTSAVVLPTDVVKTDQDPRGGLRKALDGVEEVGRRIRQRLGTEPKESVAVGKNVVQQPNVTEFVALPGAPEVLCLPNEVRHRPKTPQEVYDDGMVIPPRPKTPIVDRPITPTVDLPPRPITPAVDLPPRPVTPAVDLPPRPKTPSSSIAPRSKTPITHNKSPRPTTPKLLKAPVILPPRPQTPSTFTPQSPINLPPRPRSTSPTSGSWRHHHHNLLLLKPMAQSMPPRPTSASMQASSPIPPRPKSPSRNVVSLSPALSPTSRYIPAVSTGASPIQASREVSRPRTPQSPEWFTTSRFGRDTPIVNSKLASLSSSNLKDSGVSPERHGVEVFELDELSVLSGWADRSATNIEPPRRLSVDDAEGEQDEEEDAHVATANILEQLHQLRQQTDVALGRMPSPRIPSTIDDDDNDVESESDPTEAFDDVDIGLGNQEEEYNQLDDLDNDEMEEEGTTTGDDSDDYIVAFRRIGQKPSVFESRPPLAALSSSMHWARWKDDKELESLPLPNVGGSSSGGNTGGEKKDGDAARVSRMARILFE